MRQTISIGADDRVFVLTGAGISAESGLPTFRASDGLWAGHRIEDVCTPEAWQRNPALVWEFYSQRRAQGAKAQPNPAHLRWRSWRQRLGEPLLSVHAECGRFARARRESVRLVHMHGELAKARCGRGVRRGRRSRIGRCIESLSEVGRCACGARLRPHIVFFGEIPLEMDRIQEEIDKATLMVVVGTSGSVYPAANFVHWARQAGARTVYVGPEPPLNAGAFTHVVGARRGSVARAVC